MYNFRIILINVFITIMLNTTVMCAQQRPIRPLSCEEAIEFVEISRQNILENGTILSVTGTIYNNDKIILPLHITLSRNDTIITAEITIGDRTQEYIIDNNNHDIASNILEINDQFILSPYDIANLFMSQHQLQYIGTNHISGRPVYEFLSKQQYPNTTSIANIKISIDTKFHIPLKVEYINSKYRTIRRIMISSFKKNDDIWMPKTITLSDFSKNKKTTINIDGYNCFMAN